MNIGEIGVGSALAFAAMGSALGSGTAGMAAVGAWKKAFIQNKPAPFLLIAFVGAPLTQTIYGLILMNALMAAAAAGVDAGLLIGAGIPGGIAMGFSAWFQGKAGAVASDALAETGKGFGNYLLVLGLVETVALFVMVFLLGLVG
jgi:V/A-type H+/Na+-transporting ATPase subunit K